MRAKRLKFVSLTAPHGPLLHTVPSVVITRVAAVVDDDVTHACSTHSRSASGLLASSHTTLTSRDECAFSAEQATRRVTRPTPHVTEHWRGTKTPQHRGPTQKIFGRANSQATNRQCASVHTAPSCSSLPTPVSLGVDTVRRAAVC